MTALIFPNLNLKSNISDKYAIPTPKYNIHYLMYHNDMLKNDVNNNKLFQIDNGSLEISEYIGDDDKTITILGTQSTSPTVNTNAKKLRKLIKQRAINSLNKAYNSFRNEKQRDNKDTYSDDAVGLKLFRNKNEDIWNEFKNQLTNPKLYNNNNIDDDDKNILKHFEEDVNTIPQKSKTEGKDQSKQTGFNYDIYGLLWDNNSENLSKNVHQYKYITNNIEYISYYFLLAIYFFDYGPNLMAMNNDEIKAQNDEWITYFPNTSQTQNQNNRIHLLIRDFMDRYEADIRKNDIQEASKVYEFQKLTWDKYSVLVLCLMCLVLALISGKWVLWLVSDSSPSETTSKSNFLETVTQYYNFPIIKKLPQAKLFNFDQTKETTNFKEYNKSYYPKYSDLFGDKINFDGLVRYKVLLPYLASLGGTTIDGESDWSFPFNFKVNNYHILRWYQKLIVKYNDKDSTALKKGLLFCALILPILFVLYNIASPVFTPYTDASLASTLTNRLSTTVILWASVFSLLSFFVIWKIYYQQLFENPGASASSSVSSASASSSVSSAVASPSVSSAVAISNTGTCDKSLKTFWNCTKYCSNLWNLRIDSNRSKMDKISILLLFVLGFVLIPLGLVAFATVQVLELTGFVLYLIYRCMTNASSSFPLSFENQNSTLKWIARLVTLGLLGVLVWYVLFYKREESKEVGMRLHYTDPLKYSETRLDQLRFDALFTYFDGQETKHFGPFSALLIALGAITVLPNLAKYFLIQKLKVSSVKRDEGVDTKTTKISGIEKKLLPIIVGLVIFLISFIVVYFEVTKRITPKDTESPDAES